MALTVWEPGMDIKALKNDIRTARLAARDAIAETDRIEKSLAIADHAADALAFDPGQIISGFFPIRSEADLRPLMHRLKSRGARLCLPAVLDRQTIVFRELIDGAPLVNTGFGTTGPGPDAPVVDPDILFVPLSAFDAKGDRIGYGAGHYDRAIARLRDKGMTPRLIGVAFDCQQVEAVPAETHDVALDAVVTESGYRTFSKGH
jgi:5-formyltetrahydrofolate cyclo-ligase